MILVCETQCTDTWAKSNPFVLLLEFIFFFWSWFYWWNYLFDDWKVLHQHIVRDDISIHWRLLPNVSP